MRRTRRGHGAMKSDSLTNLTRAASSPFGSSFDAKDTTGLPDLETCRRHLLRFSREIAVSRGAKLPVNKVYFLLEGTVTLTALSATGGHHSLIYFRPGDLLSFIPSVNHAYGIPHDAFDFLLYNESLAMCAKTSCRLVCTENHDFMLHMHEEPLHTLLIRGLAGNLMKIIVQSVNNCTLPAIVRVCRMLSVSMEKDPPHALPRYLTHTEIAGHLSMHVMTVTKIFHSLRKAGILGKEHGTTFVKNPQELVKLSSQVSQLSYRTEALPEQDVAHR